MPSVFDDDAVKKITAVVQKALNADPRLRPDYQRKYRGNEGGAGFLAKITAVSGSFPYWAYTVQRITTWSPTTAATDGTNLTAYNRCETHLTSYPSEYGYGLTITASDGTINSGSCKIIPIGVGAVVWVDDAWGSDGTHYYTFQLDNSGQ